jgi:hypothetical protein
MAVRPVTQRRADEATHMQLLENRSALYVTYVSNVRYREAQRGARVSSPEGLSASCQRVSLLLWRSCSQDGTILFELRQIVKRLASMVH